MLDGQQLADRATITAFKNLDEELPGFCREDRAIMIKVKNVYNHLRLAGK
jgi:hypothetical protein